jgi:alkanesulfonate monooxygenase SsuD/methylene tetrahydromethanopterin reductase-like flavin-dependent oxidoreductase (luciferase family)
MRFGTFYFFQAAPGLTHAEVVHREFEQMEWTEELGFDEIWLTEHHFIDTVARHIQAMRDMGIGHVLCWMNFGGLPQDRIRRSMELFAREVMPHFRD